MADTLRILGFPLGAWAFALRNWAAMMLALYVAFWLQLESASSAAVCVGILSLPTRGLAFQKAVYRMAGTVVGVVVSVAIAGVFSQTRDLFFLACCVWLGLCATLASLLDGNRAYGAILSGYTVTIVALPNVDTPLSTFSDGINRGAALAIGVVAVAVVGNLFGAPDLFPATLRKIEAARDKVRAFAAQAVRQGRAEPADAVALIKQITALHPEITALPAESVTGEARFAAARTAVAALLRQVSAARVVAAALAAAGPEAEEPRANLARALEGQPHDPVRPRALAVLRRADMPADRVIAAEACLVLFEQVRDADEALDAMRDGRPPARRSRLSLYKSRPAALRNGIRAGLALAISAYLLSLLNWPATTTALVQVGAMVGLSATTPNPRSFAAGALMAMPLAVAAGGITEFLVLDGVDQFQLLTLAMGPTVIAASLMLSTGNPKLYGVGFLLIVFFPVILSPANPQSYNPQSYLFISFLALLAVVALFLLLSTVLPTSDARKRGWILKSARRDLERAVFGGRPGLDIAACTFRDADRVGQFGDLETGRTHEAELRELIRMSDLASCARRLRKAFAGTVLRDRAPRAMRALRSLDPARLRDAGRRMLAAIDDTPPAQRRDARRTGVDLLLAAALIERSPRIVAELRRVGNP